MTLRPKLGFGQILELDFSKALKLNIVEQDLGVKKAKFLRFGTFFGIGMSSPTAH